MQEGKSQALTVADVARIYKLSIWTVYRRVEDGTLKPFRIGRALRFDAEDVAATFLRVRKAVEE
ncbi:helix-turn-helix domain-containing protein [Arthrobacter sp. MI7-26]|uniref:helix-turn-helix domain-containing protein n=1 Tax=Arthrobacter sp. MI7-26 TaxID=2993653 RepID=UPI002248E98F|nr:helix-turn-helix domain-containing protein [Arthrobacter sp. MI7-26]MCX2746698.1 helix-turn-helix domain-containing protein [Arthrobacter sp. MI7-26]